MNFGCIHAVWTPYANLDPFKEVFVKTHDPSKGRLLLEARTHEGERIITWNLDFINKRYIRTKVTGNQSYFWGTPEPATFHKEVFTCGKHKLIDMLAFDAEHIRNTDPFWSGAGTEKENTPYARKVAFRDLLKARGM